MSDSYVCSGAMMKCTMGSAPAKLTVLPSRTVFLCGKPLANISDHVSMVNLAPFGVCRSLAFPPTAAATAAALGTLTPMPCIHNTPMPWMPGKPDYFDKGHPALLKSCKLQCMWGGMISLIDDGQVGEGTQWVTKLPKESLPVSEARVDDYEAVVDLRPMRERKSLTQLANESMAKDERKEARNILEFLSESATGGILWNDDRFNQLEAENNKYLETEEGKKRLNDAREAFRRVKPNLHSLTYNQLYNIVGQTIGLKEEEIHYKKDVKNSEGTLGWHPSNSKDAILNINEETDMSMCEKIAVYAHESRHVLQDLVLKKATRNPTKPMTPYEKKLKFAAQTYTSPTTDIEKYYHNFEELDSRRDEYVFGKACVEYYNETNVSVTHKTTKAIMGNTMNRQ